MRTNLRDIRKSKSLTIRDVESGTGINRGKLSEIENGIRRPTIEQRLALEDFLDTKPNELKWWALVPIDPHD